MLMSISSSALALAITLSTQESGAEAGLEVASQAAELLWDAPTVCPPRDEVIARVEGLLGRPFTESGIQAEAIVREHGENRWSLALTTWHDELTDQRTLEAQSCPTLVNALVLLLSVIEDPVETSLALAVDAQVAVARSSLREADDEQHGPVVETDEIEAAKGAPPTDERSAQARRRPVPLEDGDEGIAELPQRALSPATRHAREATPLVWSLRASGGAEIGALPTASGGLSGALTVGRGRGQLELSGLYVFPRSSAIEEIPGDVSVRVQLGAAGLRGCGLPVRGDLSLLLCTGLEVGILDGAGSGADLTQPRRQRYVWLGALVGPSLQWRVTRIASLWAGLDIVVPIIAPTFAVSTGPDSMETAHKVSPATGRLLVGLAIALGRGISKKAEAR